ncbi:NYN domain-containing protein [Reinekea thalattae]|uniref:NYN domain-containing protein n=1 Tax=Reinekea thalattae TaxID=2593301 RepID=A0A5C8ZA35_9GAMM|nr:NYN domain-containing protein [Reinekea thalattae]TXR54264.1 NYN domain-containing protein [Reinekea thalattae]
MKKISILVDVQNVYYTTRSAYQKNFDYNRFWAQVTAGGELVSAYAYAVDRGDEKQRQFQNILRAIGFEVKLKPYIQRADGSAKGDWDVGITIDALDAAQQADVVVLVSGDGDFAVLADKVRTAYGKEFVVYGVPALTAKALVDSASEFIAIDQSLLL